MQWSLMNGNQSEDGKFSEKDLMEMAKNYDPRTNKRTLVISEDLNMKIWQTIAQSEELEFVREHLYKDPDKLIWPRPPEQKKRSGVLLSFLVPGLGQIYLGQILKGVCVLLSTIFLGAITMGISYLPIWIAGMVDTHKLQKKFINGQPIKQWEFF